LQVTRHVGNLRNRAKPCLQTGRRCRQLHHVGRAHGELVLRLRNAVLNRQILHRLHEQRNTRSELRYIRQSTNHVGRRNVSAATQFERLQADQHAPHVKRWVCAVYANERRDALDRRVLEDRFGELLLTFRHGGKRGRL